MERWFYVREERRHGPVTWEELARLVASKQVAPSDIVQHEGNGNEIPACQVPGLQFGDTTRPAPVSTEEARISSESDSTQDVVATTILAGSGGVAGKPNLPGYLIVEELGRGGMGVVYKAVQVALKRQVAIKLILSGAQASGRQRLRFATEAEAIARLQHPNIVQVYDVGESNGQLFIVLEFVDGTTLAQEMARDPLATSAAARMIQLLATGVEAAHQRGIIHRDLKPGNILLTSSGAPKITDFGLAKLLDDDSGRTLTGDVMGTPSYMAPEQARGDIQAIGPCTDIYALGAMLYEMLTGRPPFRADTPAETILQVVYEEPVAPSRLQRKVPADLETICMKCLDKAPRGRYQSAAALAEDLRRFLDGDPIQARPASRRERFWRWCKRHPARASAFGLALLTTVVLIVAPLVLAIRERANADRLEKANEDISRKSEEAQQALALARQHAREAQEHRTHVERLSVGLVTDRGLDHCAKGEVALGLLWLARGLEMSEHSQSTSDLQHALRCNISSWGHQLRPLQTILSHEAGFNSLARRQPIARNPRPWEVGHRALNVAPDDRLIVTCEDKVARFHELPSGNAVGAEMSHEGTLYATSFSPDGKHLLTASSDGRCRLWDVPTGTLRRTLKHANATLVAYSSDGTQFLSVGGKEVKLWHATDTDKSSQTLLHNGRVVDAVFSPDGKLVAAILANGAIRLWQTDTGKVAKSGLAHPGETHTICFSPDCRTYLVFGSNASLWDVETGKRIALLTHPRLIWSAAYSPDSRKVVTSDVEGNAQMWDARTGGRVAFSFQEHSGGVFAVDFSPDGSVLMTAGTEGKAHFWDISSGQAAGAPIMLDTTISHARFSPGGTWIVTLNYNSGSVHIWESGRGRFRPKVPEIDDDLLALSPIDQLAAVKRHSNEVILFDLRTSKIIGSHLPHPAPVLAAAFSTRSHLLLTACADRSMHAWDSSSAERLGPSWLRSRDTGDFSFCQDGQHVLIGNEIRKAVSGKLLGLLKVTGTPVVRPDQRVLVARVSGNRARVFDGLNGMPIGQELEYLGIIMSAELSPDGSKLLYGGVNAVARVIDVETGELAFPEMQNHEQIFRVAYGPRGRFLLTGDFKKQHRLWNAHTGSPINWQAEGDIGFSNDGRLLWQINNKSLRFWHTSTGKSVGPTLQLQRPVQHIQLSANGWLREQYVDRSLSLRDLRLRQASGKPEDLSCWVKTVTGLRLDKNDLFRSIDAEGWTRMRARLCGKQ